MSNKRNSFKDPRGHSLRIYSEIFDSPAWAALTATDVIAYLALLRELKAYNNGDVSLPLSRAKKHGIRHPATLARSLRALCAVGLIAISRKGGCTKGGQRLPNLYRVTDRECYDIPAKFLEATKETHEWKRVTSVEHGHELIAATEAAAQAAAKLKSLVHRMTDTSSPREVVEAKTSSPREAWDGRPVHRVNMEEKGKNPASTRVAAGFSPSPEKATHTSSNSTPLYVAIPTVESGPTDRTAKATTDHGDNWKSEAPEPEQSAIAKHCKPANEQDAPVAQHDQDGYTRDRDDTQDLPTWD